MNAKGLRQRLFEYRALRASLEAELTHSPDEDLPVAEIGALTKWAANCATLTALDELIALVGDRLERVQKGEANQARLDSRKAMMEGIANREMQDRQERLGRGWKAEQSIEKPKPDVWQAAEVDEARRFADKQRRATERADERQRRGGTSG